MTTRRVLLLSLALLPLAGMARGEPYEADAMTVDDMRANGGLIVDIRTPEEWAQDGVIEGARLVTFKDVEQFLAELGPELSSGRDLILVCKSGRRTEAAAAALETRISNKIISVAGGMIAVQDRGYVPVPPP